ncbi:MAG: ATP-binding protein [Bacteroidales bacterium]|nr:ATP-binding protein [Bacteroidales bacterium]
MRYPLGIQTFENIRKGGYVYVDKTEYVYKMAEAGQYYFLSRPRRFGKSLLVSTMEAYFSGKKDLFQGLAIDRLEKDWIKYPVLLIAFNGNKYTSAEVLNSVISEKLAEWEKIYGAEDSETTMGGRFRGVIRRACEMTGQRVVILVDEYDAPMLDAIGDQNLLDDIRGILKGFYENIKAQDQYIRFTFFTGITKFSHMSVFSGLNNLTDISMDLRYAGICGITEEETREYFNESIREFAASNDMTFDEAWNELKEQYDGYHFHRNGVGVYNPYSLMRALESGEIGDYWFATGTPTYLVKLLQQNDYVLDRLENVKQSASQLNSLDSLHSNLIPILYQSGYLTITGYDGRFQKYCLGFPNKEVKNGFFDFLTPYYFSLKEDKEISSFIEGFVHDVETGKPEVFMQSLKTLFDDNDYRIAGEMEIYFHNSMNLIFKMLGMYTEVERATSRGRADIVVQTKDYVYIMELKLDGSAEEALRQIDEKGYAERFAMDSRKVFRIGVNFSGETRSIDAWKIAE